MKRLFTIISDLKELRAPSLWKLKCRRISISKLLLKKNISFHTGYISFLFPTLCHMQNTKLWCVNKNISMQCFEDKTMFQFLVTPEILTYSIVFTSFSFLSSYRRVLKRRKLLAAGTLQFAKQSRMIRKEIDGWLSSNTNWSLLYLQLSQAGLFTKHVSLNQFYSYSSLLWCRCQKAGMQRRGFVWMGNGFPGSEDEMLEG